MNDSEEPKKEVSVEEQRKADRAIWIIYGAMIFFILLPFVMLFFL